VKRRAFITLLGGAAAAAWPLSARAQQPAQIRRVGMLIGYTENDPETQARLAAFRQAFEQLGWKEGRSVRIDYRFAPASPDEARLFAKELVALHPDVLVGNSTPAAAALLRETRSIPIVFVGVSDPVGSQFVASIPQPGGSITGFTNFEPSLIGKWLEMLKEVAPSVTRVAVMFNPKTAPDEGAFFLNPFEPIARSLAVEPIVSRVTDANDIESAVTALAHKPGGSDHNAGCLQHSAPSAYYSSGRAALVTRNLSVPVPSRRRWLVVLRCRYSRSDAASGPLCRSHP
jgi:putative ABC transport system substrate-binding protein